MNKVITRRTHDNLDAFIAQRKNQFQSVEPQNQTEEPIKQKTKTVRKSNDGLMERMDKKIIIAEDNRQLITD